MEDKSRKEGNPVRSTINRSNYQTLLSNGFQSTSNDKYLNPSSYSFFEGVCEQIKHLLKAILHTLLHLNLLVFLLRAQHSEWCLYLKRRTKKN